MLYGNNQFELKSNATNSIDIEVSQKYSQANAINADQSSLNQYKLKKTKTGVQAAPDISGSIYSDVIDSDEDRGPGGNQGISIADNATVFNMEHPRDT